MFVKWTYFLFRYMLYLLLYYHFDILTIIFCYCATSQNSHVLICKNKQSEIATALILKGPYCFAI